MRTASWNALLGAGLIAFAGCASQQKQAAQNPGAQRVQTAQQTSEEQLKSAQEAQKQASAQQQQAAKAQVEAQKKQQELEQAQNKAQQETAKAQQEQQQANQQTKQATAQAQQNQKQATGALGDESQRVKENVQTFAGQVNRASGSSLRVTPPNGDPMTFRITPQTEVRVDGQQGKLSQIQPGSDARVAYDMNGPTPTARTVYVSTGKVHGKSSSAGSSGPSGTASNSQ
jgi:hypothetical protein